MRNSNRVIINTGVQYIRSFITIIVTLYTSRIVLNNLGQNDFGIYSLVGGIISMLSFIRVNLSQTNVRFLSYFRGQNNDKKIIEIFNNSITTQVLLGGTICIILFALTNPIFNNFLNISLDRINEAKVVYYLMLCSLFFNFLSVPYLSNLISRENIIYSSVVQIFDAILKIPIALSLIWITENKLEWYAFWTMFIIFLNFFLYVIYCRKKYPECRHYSLRNFNISLFKEMFSFMGWGIYGTLCVVGRQQGIAILLNRYYSTAINAAYGIAFQVAGQLNFISVSLTNAINPQIMKAEGKGNRQKMFRLSEISCKFSFLLMSMLSIPTFIYMPYILEIWLKNVPEYTTLFCRCILISIQIDLLSTNLSATNQAVGNVRSYNLCLNTIKIITLPVAWLALHLGYSAKGVMIVYIVFELFVSVARVIFLHYNINFSIKNYIYNVILKIMPPFILNIIVCIMLSKILEGWEILITFVFSILITTITIYLVGLTKDEKDILQLIIKKFKH